MISNPAIKYYVIHHTASYASNGSQLLPVNNFHRNERGWTKSSLGWYVGYNYFIDTDGTVTNTRSVGEETFAQVGHNCDVQSRCDAVSICLAGDFNQQLPNQRQVESLNKLILELSSTYSGIQRRFHRELQKNRTCPGQFYTEEYHNTVVMKTSKPKPDELDEKKREQIKELSTMLDKLKFLVTRWFDLKAGRK